MTVRKQLMSDLTFQNNKRKGIDITLLRDLQDHYVPIHYSDATFLFLFINNRIL